MPVTLAGIPLPEDIQWENEFAGFGVGQTITPTITAALVVEENSQPEGRPITLRSNGASWVQRSVVESLDQLAATPLNDATLTLVWGDGRSFEVIFDRTNGNGFAASEVRRLAAAVQGAAHKYFIDINLIIKEPTP